MNILKSNSIIVGNFVVIKRLSLDIPNQIWNTHFLNTRGISTSHLRKVKCSETDEYDLLMKLENGDIQFEDLIVEHNI